MSSSHRQPAAGKFSMGVPLLLLLLLVVVQFASALPSAAAGTVTLSKGMDKIELPMNAVVLGPIRALPPAPSAKKSIVQGPTDDADGANAAGDTIEPVVSARSILLNNNITISQSRLVLSRLDQLFLLKQLLGTLDLAPKMASLTGKVSGGANGKQEGLEDSGPFAEGFLFELSKAGDGGGGDDRDDDNVMAVVDVGGSKLGFGWRYPLAYWNKLRTSSKPKCPFGRSVGRYYYC